MPGITGRLQIGLSLPTWDDGQGHPRRWSQLKELALMAEQAGIDSLWAPDHLLRLGGQGKLVGFWECWTILSALAEATSRVTIGPLVNSVAFRNPALVAKMAETLDEVSGGRVILALGAGDPQHDHSFRAFGYAPGQPASRLEEAAQVITGLLRNGPLTAKGEYYEVNGAQILPRGPRPGRLPVWVGAKGPHTIGIAARYGDALNLNAVIDGPEMLAEPFAMLATACQAARRDPATIRRTGYTVVSFAGPGADMTGPRALALKGEPAAIAAQIQAIHSAGIEHLTFFIDDGEDPGPVRGFAALTARGLEKFAPVLQELHKLEASSEPAC